MTETGKLFNNMDAKPGDVLRCVYDANLPQFWKLQKHYPVGPDGELRDEKGHAWDKSSARFVLASRVTPTLLKDMSDEEAGKLWANMTPEEKGALLLAHHEGKAIQYKLFASNEWRRCVADPVWAEVHAYRIAPPEPVRGTVTLYGSNPTTWMDKRWVRDTHSLTFPTLDGEPIPGVYRDDQGNEITMEKLT